MLYTLKQLRYLVAIAETGKITKAAEKMHISQPSLSAAINQLEHQFDTQFLIRYKAKGVALTPAGRKFVAEARQLLLHSDELSKSIGSYGNELEGEMTLGCYTTIAPFFIPNLLKDTKLKYPKLLINAVEKNLDEIQNNLFNGFYELALLYNINLDAGISTSALKNFRPYIIVSSNHRLARRKRVTLKELADEPYIMLDLPNSRDYFKAVFNNNGVNPVIQYKSQSFEMVRCLVAQQHGYSILNLLPYNNTTYDNGKLSCIEIAGKQEPLEIALAHVKNLKLSHQAQLFSEYCIKHFSTS